MVKSICLLAKSIISDKQFEAESYFPHRLSVYSAYALSSFSQNQ